MLSCNVSVMIQCGKNLDSWQGEVFGFPNPLLGIAGWMAPLFIGVALLAGSRFPRWFWMTFGAGVTFAFGLVCWLIWQSIYAPNLGVLCPWCMLTWSVTIPTFFATMLHLTRNGTFTSNEKLKDRANRLMVWVPSRRSSPTPWSSCSRSCAASTSSERSSAWSSDPRLIPHGYRRSPPADPRIDGRASSA